MFSSAIDAYRWLLKILTLPQNVYCLFYVHAVDIVSSCNVEWPAFCIIWHMSQIDSWLSIKHLLLLLLISNASHWLGPYPEWPLQVYTRESCTKIRTLSKLAILRAVAEDIALRGSFWVWAQSVKGDVTNKQRLSLVGPIPRMTPAGLHKRKLH